MELFQNGLNSNQPLAARMRPTSLDTYIGQQHILGEGRLLRRLIQADRLSSLIFYGPPGTGKTTLAWVIANTTKSRFVVLNAVLSGVKELRVALDEAAQELSLYGKKTILFIDEVHRWNKSQQDALLPWVENGTVILIGATTENPYFEVNPALVSRSRIFRLVKLNDAEMRQVVSQVLNDIPLGYGALSITIDDDALAHLIKTADGDARNLLNALELAVETTKEIGKGIHITLDIAEDSIQQKAVLYDKEGDYHYDVISAFIKSLRGSDADAALYWLARMINAGENPRFIFRRMLILACEDVGLADPQAIAIVEAAASAFDRVGLPEGNYMLAHATLYLATAKKSNSAMGFFDALSSIQNESFKEVPTHLKDPSKDGKSFGHAKGYLYPHAYKDHWVAQNYLPDSLKGKIFYHPSSSGYEATIRDEVLRRQEIQLESSFPIHEESYSFSPENKAFSAWQRRSEKQLEDALVLRDEIVKHSRIKNNSRILILEENSALLYWESLRRAKEGGVYLLSNNKNVIEHINHFFYEYEIDDTPLIIDGSRKSDGWIETLVSQNKNLRFDRIIGRAIFNGFFSLDKVKAFLSKLVILLETKGLICFSLYNYEDSTTLLSLLLLKENEKYISPTLRKKIMFQYQKFCENQFTSCKNHAQFLTTLEETLSLKQKFFQFSRNKKVVLSESVIDSLLSKNSFSLFSLFTAEEQKDLANIFKQLYREKEISILSVDNIYLLCDNE